LRTDAPAGLVYVTDGMPGIRRVRRGAHVAYRFPTGGRCTCSTRKGGPHAATVECGLLSCRATRIPFATDMMKLQASSAPRRAPPRLRRVLVVDDNHDAADTLGAMLSFLGYDVRVAYDSESGLAAAGWFEPDVAVWDISLPGVNGYEAAQRLRAFRDGRKILLIALTAHATPADRLAALAAGFDQHMKKPIDVNALLGELGCP
jgi:CheY-like chemotaxis protein